MYLNINQKKKLGEAQRTEPKNHDVRPFDDATKVFCGVKLLLDNDC